MTSNPKKQLRLDPDETKALQLVLRKAAGFSISPEDEAYLERYSTTVTSLYSQVTAFRNYFDAVAQDHDGCDRHKGRSSATCFKCFQVRTDREHAGVALT